MQVKLRVIGGKNEGREIKISVPEFVIGRGEGTHLRPQSDLISRRHCSINIEDGKCVIKDFGSRNGTFVNGERVEGELQLKFGDRLRVGRLQFEVVIDHAAAGSKKPRVEGVKEAAIRTAQGAVKTEGIDEDSITDWLMEADAPDRPQRRENNETRQFMLDETEQLTKLSSDPSVESTNAAEEETIADEADTDSTVPKEKDSGKLPFKPKMDSVDSRDAASQVLRKFFNRR